MCIAGHTPMPCKCVYHINLYTSVERVTQPYPICACFNEIQQEKKKKESFLQNIKGFQRTVDI